MLARVAVIAGIAVSAVALLVGCGTSSAPQVLNASAANTAASTSVAPPISPTPSAAESSENSVEPAAKTIELAVNFIGSDLPVGSASMSRDDMSRAIASHVKYFQSGSEVLSELAADPAFRSDKFADISQEFDQVRKEYEALNSKSRVRQLTGLWTMDYFQGACALARAVSEMATAGIELPNSGAGNPSDGSEFYDVLSNPRLCERPFKAGYPKVVSAREHQIFQNSHNAYSKTYRAIKSALNVAPSIIYVMPAPNIFAPMSNSPESTSYVSPWAALDRPWVGHCTEIWEWSKRLGHDNPDDFCTT